MPDAAQKIKIALDECRMLVLGTQVLISLQFELSFQNKFASTPRLVQVLVAVGLALLLLTFDILVLAPAYHRIAADGNVGERIHRFMTKVIAVALWPLGASLGLDVFIAFDVLIGRTSALAAGIGLIGLCFVLWYVLGTLGRTRSPEEVKEMDRAEANPRGQQPSLNDRVSQVLTEARVVLPGAQAMLGFQFITMFEQAFAQIPLSSKLIHLGCLTCIALTVVLLMTPAAFHRIGEGGEDSQRLVHISSRFVVAAMLPLGLGMAGDLFVVLRKITNSLPISIGGAAAAVVVAFGLWFGFSLWCRGRLSARQQSRAALARSR